MPIADNGEEGVKTTHFCGRLLWMAPGTTWCLCRVSDSVKMLLITDLLSRHRRSGPEHHPPNRKLKYILLIINQKFKV